MPNQHKDDPVLHAGTLHLHNRYAELGGKSSLPDTPTIRMAITELALLRVSDGAKFQNDVFKTKLRAAKLAMEAFTGHQFDYLQQVADPAAFYIVGSWDSLEQHLEDWIPSQANQSLLASLKDDIQLEWLVHIDAEKSSLPLGAPFVAIGKHFVLREQQAGFMASFEVVKPHLAIYTEPYAPLGGWVLETKSAPKEEFVLFSGWKEVANHHAFTQTAEFDEYREKANRVVDYDVKFAHRLTL